MKYLLLLLLLPLNVFAQKAEFSKIIESNGAASKLYEKSIAFTKQPEIFFIPSEGVKNKKWALGRAKWGAPNNKIILGYDYSVEEEKSVTAHCLWIYEDRSNDGCVKLLTVTGDVSIHCKDNKVKIDITNLKYAHYNKDAPPSVKPIGYGKKVKAYGAYADLLKELNNKAICPATLKSVADFIDASADMLINKYQEYLNKDEGKSDNW